MDRRDFFGWGIAGAAGLITMMPATVLAQDRTLHRRLRFAITFTNPLARSLEGQRYWGYLPANAEPGQRLQALTVSAPHLVHRDSVGHRILELAFDHFPALAHKVVTVTAEVAFAPATRLDAAVAPYLAMPEQWLGPERFIESAAAEVVAVAATLRRTTELDGARAIYDWVQGNLSYAGYLADDLGALYALRHRRGDCTEYADLVVALARANGIAARMVGGYVMEQDGAPRSQDYHNWAELYLAGAWRVVDAQKGNYLPQTGSYVALRIHRDALDNPVGSAHRYRMQGDLLLST